MCPRLPSMKATLILPLLCALSLTAQATFLRSAALDPAAAAARKACIKYLTRQLSYRFTPVQINNGCNHYVSWGVLTRNGPARDPAAAQQRYWDALINIPQPRRPLDRKEYRVMTDAERRRFHNAVVTLKRTLAGDINRYDVLVAFHQPALSPGAHFGAAFLGWHREYVFRMECALQQIDSGVTVPYWDSTMDEVLGDQARNSIMWTPDFMGNLDGDVVTGPFANWPLLFPVGNRTRLFREAVPEGGLFSDEVVNRIVNAPDFRSITWFVDPTFEAVHGTVHDWVGGVLGDLGGSPGDPVFFVLHSFVDCVFWEHRAAQIALGVDVRFNYPNDTVAMGVGIAPPEGDVVNTIDESLHQALDPMAPFEGLLNIDGLSVDYADYYTCTPRPTCSRQRPTCGSPYLFCETARQKCAPKLQEGASCTQWADMDPCYNSVCCQGRCSRSCAPARPVPPQDFRFPRGLYPFGK